MPEPPVPPLSPIEERTWRALMRLMIMLPRTATLHGGHESTLLALYNTFHHFGGLVAAPGYTDPIKFVDGNPYGASHTAGGGDIPIPATTHQAASYQGARVARLAAALAAGLGTVPSAA